MARKSRNKPIKKVIYVFWEGETEQEYIKFLKDEFENIAVIYYCTKKGTFEVAKSYYNNKDNNDNKNFRNIVPELDELWFFFDTEIEMGNKWDEKMNCLEDIINSRKKRNPLKIRLLMTTGCAEYWLLLHYRKTAPAIATPADKDKILMEVKR